ncbi:MAG: hypothetical protein HY974_04490 [Candidatus Kerfeldbacteria bacterium]|nr:hypothetical protein [Candidatus Kerfeldbacteria bacterium]
MPQEVAIKDLVVKIDDLARLTADGFAGVDKRFEQVDRRFEQVDKRFNDVDKRFDEVERRLTIVEHKLDRVLYDELDRHERWIKLLANKVGVELSR